MASSKKDRMVSSLWLRKKRSGGSRHSVELLCELGSICSSRDTSGGWCGYLLRLMDGGVKRNEVVGKE